MKLADSYVTVVVPRWRIGAAQVLLFTAWLFGAGESRAVWSNIGAFLARGAKVEFTRG